MFPDHEDLSHCTNLVKPLTLLSASHQVLLFIAQLARVARHIAYSALLMVTHSGHWVKIQHNQACLVLILYLADDDSLVRHVELTLRSREYFRQIKQSEPSPHWSLDTDMQSYPAYCLIAVSVDCTNILTITVGSLPHCSHTKNLLLFCSLWYTSRFCPRSTFDFDYKNIKIRIFPAVSFSPDVKSIIQVQGSQNAWVL